MKMKIWTRQPNYFIRETGKVLRRRGHSKAQADALLNGQFDGELVTFDALCEAQFCALEDTAARMGLQYDGSQ